VRRVFGKKRLSCLELVIDFGPRVSFLLYYK